MRMATRELLMTEMGIEGRCLGMWKGVGAGKIWLDTLDVGVNEEEPSPLLQGLIESGISWARSSSVRANCFVNQR